MNETAAAAPGREHRAEAAPGPLGPVRTLATAAAVAVAYYVSGWFGLALALPPGYATAVWPASGVALAATILIRPAIALPAIWLGSFLLNLRTGLDTSDAGTILLSLPVPAIIAAGAAAQAFAGAWLIRRFVGYHNLLVQELDVIRMLLLAGPLACLINASVGSLALLAAGKVALQGLGYTWWTWWVGDSIGVMVFAPVILVWSVRPYGDWLPKQLAVSVPLVVLFSIVVVLFAYSSQREQERIREGVESLASEARDRLRREIESYLQALHAIRGLYATAQGVNQKQFEAFGRALAEPLPGIQRLQWAPLVQGAVLERFEQSARADGLTGFRVTGFDAEGNRVPVTRRSHHFPIHFVAPGRGNETVVGFDLGSDPLRMAAIAEARDRGEPVLTPALRLADGDRGIVALLPVYWYGFPQDSVSTRRQNLHGLAVAVIRVERMVAPVQELLDREEAEFVLYDDAAPEGQRVLHRSQAAVVTEDSYREELPVFLGARPWRLDVIIPASRMIERRSWQAWAVLAIGLLLTSLVGVMLLLAVGRAARIEALVEERTHELRNLNRNLMTEVERRRRLEEESEQRAAQLAETNQELQRRDDLNRELLHNLRRSETTLRRTANDLAASNRELEQFAYVASHDLKAPLRTISSFSQLLEKRYAGKLDDEAREFLGFIADGIRHMQSLIDDLLQLSRVDARSLHIGRVRMDEVARQVCRQLGADLEATGGKVEFGELPEVNADPRLLVQLLQNLIGNGIKFQKPGGRPEIRIDAVPEGDFWHFTIGDNGIGIADNHLSQIFMIFKRLHTTDQYPGSGIGLAICRKVVQLHGGEIWATSVLDEGTTIHFTLPRSIPDATGEGDKRRSVSQA